RGALVALSGGVDSAVTALRLVEQGRTLEAAMVRLWPGEDERSCCSPGALQRARRVAAAAGIPFHVIDSEHDFVAHVVEPFVGGYLAGETPNPCVACNPRRLAALVNLAEKLGLARVATGHYARLAWIRDEPYLARAADRAKDQSYMLWAVPPDVLARLEFPLGDLTKAEVRAAAAAAASPVAAQSESQEVCFAVHGYHAFLEQRGVGALPGAIVDSSGSVLGEHQGHWRYTIGQRRGLGVVAPRPLYVLERRAAVNEVVVGGAGELEVREVSVRELLDRGLGEGSDVSVQLRYRSAAVPVVRVERRAGRAAVIHLKGPFAGVAPGQSAVFYRDDVVVGGAVIAAQPKVPQGV
ncbi:MAG TPA: tRNA 2-thiouridine(34) synthase MnmA, partial [Thermoleophilia bacterium]|nr:tRNA 2-thiouridine(34) synthase MnmA [Thermoleophilia bacterium]